MIEEKENKYLIANYFYVSANNENIVLASKSRLIKSKRLNDDDGSPPMFMAEVSLVIDKLETFEFEEDFDWVSFYHKYKDLEEFNFFESLDNNKFSINKIKVGSIYLDLHNFQCSEKNSQESFHFFRLDTNYFTKEQREFFMKFYDYFFRKKSQIASDDIEFRPPDKFNKEGYFYNKISGKKIKNGS